MSYDQTMTKTNYEKLNCPVARCLSVLGDQWTFLIIRDTFSGKTRFGEFQESLGISKNLLSRRLEELCAIGVLDRKPIPGSKRFEYLPTEKCFDLRPVVLSMAAWGNRWFAADNLSQIECSDKTTGHPVEVGFIDTVTNQKIGSSDLHVERREAQAADGASR